MTRLRVFLFTTASAAIVGISVPALAQGTAQNVPATPSSDQPSDSQSGVADIVVTAQKRSESVNKVGISINAVSGDALHASGVTSTADLTKLVSGFRFTPSAYGTPVFQLRGLGFYDTSLAASPTVSLYVDEVPLPLSIMSTAATLDVERVEVLKGPQGTLFGQNSTGGAINYIAAKPTNALHYGVDATYGRFDQGGVAGFVSGPLSDTLRARVAFRWDHSGDWQSSYTRDAKRGSGNVYTGRLLLDWTPTERLTVSFNGNAFKDRSDNQGAQLVAIITPTSPTALKSFPLPPAKARATDWDPNRNFRRDTEFYQGSLRIDYDISDEDKLTSITAGEHLRRRSDVDADGTSLAAFAVTTPGKSTNFSQELRLSGHHGIVQYVVGGNYGYDDIKEQGSLLDASVSSIAFRATRSIANQKVNTYAAFGNLDIKVLDTVTVTGGLRYTDQHRAFEGCTYDVDGVYARIVSGIASRRSGQVVAIPQGGCVTLGANFLPGVQHQQLNEDSLSWKAGVNWQITPAALLYANVSRGYKAGAFPVVGAATYAVLYSPAVQESVLAYEAGYKLTLFDRKLQFNGAGFYYDYSNKQLRGKLFDPVLGFLSALINVPKSRISGFELQAIAAPVRGLNITSGITYADTHILHNFTNYDALGQLQNFDGQELPLTPKWQANVDAQYEFAVGGELRAFIGGNVNYQARNNGGLGQLAPLDIPSYTLFDARVGIKSAEDSWRATLFVRNITDKYYWTLANLPGADAVVKYAGLPRTFGVTLSYKY
ncbi:MAG TPA: TonB-dependent receptor [Sphingobium sp.]